MKEKKKPVILLFFICLVFIPSFIYSACMLRANQQSEAVPPQHIEVYEEAE